MIPPAWEGEAGPPRRGVFEADLYFEAKKNAAADDDADGTGPAPAPNVAASPATGWSPRPSFRRGGFGRSATERPDFQDEGEPTIAPDGGDPFEVGLAHTPALPDGDSTDEPQPLDESEDGL